MNAAARIRPATTTAQPRKVHPFAWPKACGCGKTYDPEQWKTLQYIGIQRIPAHISIGFPDMELRNCSCGSTLAVAAPDDLTE